MKRWGGSLIGIVIVGFFSLYLFDALPGRELSSVHGAPQMARLIFVQGPVEIRRARTSRWISATTGMELAQQDAIRTGAGATAEIAFGDLKDQNVTRLGQNSEIILESLAPYQLRLPKGELLSLVKKLPRKSKFEVRTPTAIVGVRGTGWETETDGRTTEVAAFEETIAASCLNPEGNATASLEIGEGFQTGCDALGNMGALEKIAEREMERFQEWKEEIEEHLQEAAPPAKTDAEGEGTFSPLEQVEQEGELLGESQQEFFEEEEEEERFGGATSSTAASSSSSSSASSSSAAD